MANKRIKDLTTESSLPATDDYIELDGATNGSRKQLAQNLGLAAKATRPGIISTGAAAVGTTQDNTGLAFGTGDFSVGALVRLPDWTPAASRVLARKLGNNNGVQIQVMATSGLLRAYIGNGAGQTTYDSTVAPGLTDGAWAFIAATFDADGNLVFYVNGAQLGASVSIAALSAVSRTNTDALRWFSDGTNHTEGTLGESWIINGLLTATDIANIYRAGSIAPFAASFTFYQWCDFGQGYGPIIRDRSGANQQALMGTSGLSHAVPRNPPGIPSRAPRTALVLDGSSGSLARSTLNAQDPSTGELTVWVDFVFPTSSDSTTRSFFCLSSSTSNRVGKALEAYINNGATVIRLFGATLADERTLAFPSGFATLMAGKRCVLVVGRGLAYLGVEGDFFNVTNLLSGGMDGTPPAWTDDVDGTYLFGASSGSGGNSVATTLYDLRLANVAMTEAQLRTEYERGEPGPEWSGASKTSLYTSDFSAGVDGWATDSSGVNRQITGNVDGVDGQDDWLKVETLATETSYAYTGVIFSQFHKRRRATVRIHNPAGSPFGYVAVGQSGTQAVGASAQVVAVAAGSTVDADVAFINTTGTRLLTIVTDANGAPINVASGNPVYLKLVNVYSNGWTARLRTDTAAGLTALNGAKSSTNDSTDFLLSTTGVTTSPDGRRQVIRATTNTNGNQQLLGASVIDTVKKWRIVSWNITSSGTPNVTLGSASAGTQYLASTAMAAALNEITLVTRIPASANLWCNSNSTATLQHVVILEQVE